MNYSACVSSEVLLGRSTRASTVYFVTFVYIYVFTAVVSTVLNALIISTLLLAKELHGVFYKILGSLFISDLITGSVIFPMLAILNATFTQPDCLLLTACQLCVHTISLASILSMMAIAYDRFLRAWKRHNYSMCMNQSKGHLIVVSIWIVSPVVGALTTFVYEKLIAILAVFVVVLILIFYLITLRKLKSSRNRVSDTLSTCPSHSGPNPTGPTNGVRRSSRLVFVLVLVMLLSWLPSISISLVSSEKLYSTNRYFLTAVQQLPLLSAITSPFLYFWTNRTTRRCFIAFCQKIFCHKRHNTENNVTAFSH